MATGYSNVKNLIRKKYCLFVKAVIIKTPFKTDTGNY